MLEGKIKRLANVIIDLLVDEFLPVFEDAQESPLNVL